MKNISFFRILSFGALTVLCLFSTAPGSAQCQLPLHFGFDSPPEFDPATMEAIPNLTGQNGLVEIANGVGAKGTPYYVRLSKTVADGGFTQSALNLKMDLSGCAGKQLELSFYVADNCEETQYYDGVFLSDGLVAAPKRVIALEPARWCDNTWGFFRVDLDELIAQHGLSYTSTFIVQFRHEGNQAFNGFYCSDRDNLFIDEVHIGEAPPVVPAPVPFAEGFASGLANDPAWHFQPMQLTPTGELTDFKTPYEWTAKENNTASDGDGYSLFMGKWKNCADEMQRNTADLHLNLSGLDSADLELSFDFVNFYDETQFYDGIWLSSDGGKTFPVKPAISLEPGTWHYNTYGNFAPFDLDALIRNQGLAFTSDFVIRFQHQDEQSKEPGLQSWQVDGVFFDNIRVNILPPVAYKQVPFSDNLDQAGINLDHWRVGNARLDGNGKPLPGVTPSQVCGLYPIFGNGPKSWHLGKLNDNNGVNTNQLDLHIRAANYHPLMLTFDLYEFWEEYQTEDGISLSVDGGLHFTSIYNFDWAANPNGEWKTFQIPLSSLAADSGLVLSNQTVLRFGQNGTGDWAGGGDLDGYAIKNIGLSGTVATNEAAWTKQNFSVFPNPASEGFTVAFDLESNSDYQISLVDPTGRMVFQQQYPEVSAGNQQTFVRLTDAVSHGTYFVWLEKKGEKSVQRLIIH